MENHENFDNLDVDFENEILKNLLRGFYFFWYFEKLRVSTFAIFFTDFRVQSHEFPVYLKPPKPGFFGECELTC